VARLPDPQRPLIEGEDYVMKGPYLVFTAAYHRKRGYCCESGCRNCPWRMTKEDFADKHGGENK